MDNALSRLPVLITAPDWLFGQGALNGPAVVYPKQDSLVIHASVLSPLRQRERLSSISNQSVISPIVLLLFHRGPAAILRFVIAGRIFSIQSEPDRRIAHICQEVVERGSPSFTYDNPPSTVFLVSRDFWIMTTLNHIDPNSIYTSLAQTMRCIALSANSPFLVLVIATTRGCMALMQTLRSCLNDISAVASAFKNSASKFVRAGTANHKQASEALAGKINVGRHVSQWYLKLLRKASMSIGDCQLSGAMVHV